LNEIVLIGRNQELELIRNTLGKSINNGGQILFINGEGGLGKTHLVRYYLEQIKKDNYIYSYVQCVSQLKGEELYRPFIEVIGHLLPKLTEEAKPQTKFKKFFGTNAVKILDVASEIMGVVPGVGLVGAGIKIALSLRSDKDPREMEKDIEKYKNDRVSFYTDIIIGLSLIRPVTIVLDDIHWADMGTLTVLRELFRSLLSLRESGKKPQLLIICNLRNIEGKIDDVGKDVQKLREFYLRYDERESRIFREHNLSTMSREDLNSLIGYELDNSFQISELLKQWIIEKSSGSPLILSRTIDVLKRYKAIYEENNLWKDSGDIEKSMDRGWVLKGKVLAAQKSGDLNNSTASVLEPLNNLTPEDRNILLHAAVQGVEFFSDVLAYQLAIDETKILWNLNKLIKLGFIEKMDDVKRCMDETYRFRFTSQVMHGMIQSELFPKQIRSIELKIATFLIETIDEAEKYKEYISELIDDRLGSTKTDLCRQQNNIRAQILSLYREVSMHYEKSACFVKAAEYALKAMQNDIERLENMQFESPSPIERENLERQVNYQISRIKRLISTSFTEPILDARGEYHSILSIEIKAHILHSKLYILFGDYQKASLELLNARELAVKTEIISDDLDIDKAIIDLNYKQGNFKEARIQIDRFITIIDNSLEKLSEDEKWNYLSDMSEIVGFNESPPIGIDLINKLVDVSVKIGIKDKAWIVVNKLSLYLKLQDIFNAIKLTDELLGLKSTDAIEALIHTCTRISGMVCIPQILLGEQLYLYEDKEYLDDHVQWDPYIFNWRLEAAEFISDLMKKILKKPLLYGVSMKEESECFDIIIDIAAWLYNNSEKYSRSYYDESSSDTNYEKIWSLQDRMLNISNKRFPVEEMEQLILRELKNTKIAEGDDVWIEKATFCLLQFSNCIPLSEAKSLFNKLETCPIQIDVLKRTDIYLSWIHYLNSLDNKMDTVDYVKETVKTFNNFMPELMEADINKAIEVKDVIIEYFYMLVEDSESVWKRAIDLCIICVKNGDMENAIEILEKYADKCNIKKKELNLTQKQIENKCETVEKKVANNVVDNFEGDEYGDIRNAEQLIKIAQYMDEDELDDKLIYLKKAEKLASKHELGKTLLDNIYSELSDFWNCLECMPSKQVLKDLEISLPQNLNERESCLAFSLKDSIKAIQINMEVKDWNRVEEEYQRILGIMGGLEDELSKKSIKKVISYASHSGFDYINEWSDFIKDTGRVDFAIWKVIYQFELMEGYNIIDKDEMIEPVFEFKLIDAIVDYLKGTGNKEYIIAYKNYLERLLYPGKQAEKILQIFSN
jgi:hypothetical protein